MHQSADDGRTDVSAPPTHVQINRLHVIQFSWTRRIHPQPAADCCATANILTCGILPSSCGRGGQGLEETLAGETIVALLAWTGEEDKGWRRHRVTTQTPQRTPQGQD